MDWTAIITNTITTVGAIGVAWMALRGKLAELGKTTKAAQQTAENAQASAEEAAAAATKTEKSINNRPIPASDRWDLIHASIKDLGRVLADHGTALAEQGKDIRGLHETAQQTRRSIGHLRAEDRLGRQETEQLRHDFSEHTEQAAMRDRLIKELHDQYSQVAKNARKEEETP